MASLTRDEWVAKSNAEKFADLAELLETPLAELYASRDSDVYGPAEEAPEETTKETTGSTRKGSAKSG